MDQEKRSQLIRSYLQIKPINHGQLYGYQIAIPSRESITINEDRYEAIAASLQQHQTNIIPLIVRPTTAYNDEQEYELVYGADWLIVAEKFNIERLWVWMFDLNNDQMIEFQREMEQLITGTGEIKQQLPELRAIPQPSNSVVNDLEIKEMIKAETEQLKSQINDLKNQVGSLKNQFNAVEDKLNQLLEVITLSAVTRSRSETIDKSGSTIRETDQYATMTIAELKAICRKLKIAGYSNITRKNKHEFIAQIRQKEGN